jgi:hypothetical protein
MCCAFRRRGVFFFFWFWFVSVKIKVRRDTSRKVGTEVNLEIDSLKNKGLIVFEGASLLIVCRK